MSCHHKPLADRANAYNALETEQIITWCGGCGNYSIQNALRRALTLEDKTQRDFILCFDVGCNGNGSDKIHANTIHGLHGRVLPLAAGVALANRDVKVIASAGDGATFSEGVGHIVHAVRSDYPVMFLHHNNHAYALTTGQASSLTPCGQKMSAAPDGAYTPPLQHLDMILSLNPSFVARTCSADPDHMTKTFRAAMNHDGFAFIDVLQACPTYNRATTNGWYLERIKDISERANYDKTSLRNAREIISIPENEALWLGVLYENPRANYYDQMPMRHGVTTTLVNEVQPQDISSHLARLTA